MYTASSAWNTEGQISYNNWFLMYINAKNGSATDNTMLIVCLLLRYIKPYWRCYAGLSEWMEKRVNWATIDKRWYPKIWHWHLATFWATFEITGTHFGLFAANLAAVCWNHFCCNVAKLQSIQIKYFAKYQNLDKKWRDCPIGIAY